MRKKRFYVYILNSLSAKDKYRDRWTIADDELKIPTRKPISSPALVNRFSAFCIPVPDTTFASTDTRSVGGWEDPPDLASVVNEVDRDSA